MPRTELPTATPILPAGRAADVGVACSQRSTSGCTGIIAGIASRRWYEYGATIQGPSFFAVATETFFEKPVQLEREHPELYGQLRQFYQQDPARRAPPP